VLGPGFYSAYVSLLPPSSVTLCSMTAMPFHLAYLPYILWRPGISVPVPAVLLFCMCTIPLCMEGATAVGDIPGRFSPICLCLLVLTWRLEQCLYTLCILHSGFWNCSTVLACFVCVSSRCLHMLLCLSIDFLLFVPCPVWSWFVPTFCAYMECFLLPWSGVTDHTRSRPVPVPYSSMH
jgi:hypothetical protein